jgi:biopolymer transport protein ExbD
MRRRVSIDMVWSAFPVIAIYLLSFVAFFLLPQFYATGEVACCKPPPLPRARFATLELPRAPIIQIDRLTSIDGIRAEGEALTDKIHELRKIEEMMHPGSEPLDLVIISAARTADFGEIRSVMDAASAAGIETFSLAVETVF